MLVHKGSIYKEAAKLVMYHGTASGEDGEVLRKILKMGFDPTPNKRIFEVEKGGEEKVDDWSEQLETFGGSYFTDDLLESLNYADIAYSHVKGQRLIIVAKMETRTPHVTIDEDHFLRTVDLKGYNLKPKGKEGLYSNVDLWEDYQKGNIDVLSELLDILMKRIKEHRLPITVEDLMRYEDRLRKMFELSLEYHAARDWYGDDAERDQRLKELGVRNSQEIISEYRDVANALYLKLHKITDPVEGEPRNVRSMEPVTYRGKNRIVGVLGWTPSRRGRYSLEGVVYYDKDPAVVDAIKQINSIYIESGKPTQWKDPQGNDIPELTGKRRTWAAVDYDDYLLEEVIDKLKEDIWDRDLEYPEEELQTEAVETVLEAEESTLLEEVEAACNDTCPGCAQAAVARIKESEPGSIVNAIEWDFGSGGIGPDVYRKLAHAVSRTTGRYKDAVAEFTRTLVDLTEDQQEEISDLFLTADAFLLFNSDYYEDDPIVQEKLEDSFLEYDLEMEVSDISLNFEAVLPHGNIDRARIEVVEMYMKEAALEGLIEWINDHADDLCEEAEPRAASVKEEDTMKKEANPAWWGTAEEDFAVDPNSCLPVADILTEFDEMIAVQGTDGNWNFDPYMHGLYNGLVYMKSLIDGQDPQFMEAPEEWLSDRHGYNDPGEKCYQDDLGNEMCEGPPHPEDPSMALVPFNEGSEDDSMYLTAAARSRGLNFVYPKAEETWPPRGKNLYHPDPHREGGKLPFKKVRKRTEDNPTIVETCGRNYITPECLEEYEKGFNAVATALVPVVRQAAVPYEAVEVAEWEVVSTEDTPIEDVEMHGDGPYENIQEKPVFTGWEGDTVLRTNMSGVQFTIRLDWFLHPDHKGPEDLDIQGVKILEGPSSLKVESHDGTILPISEWFRNEMPSILWDYDLAREIFPVDNDEFAGDDRPAWM